MAKQGNIGTPGEIRSRRTAGGARSPRPGTNCRGSINPVRLITTLKLRRKQLGDSFIRSLHFIITEEYIMAQTQKQRMALIRKVSKKFNTKLQRNQRVRKTETSFLDKIDKTDVLKNFLVVFNIAPQD